MVTYITHTEPLDVMRRLRMQIWSSLVWIHRGLSSNHSPLDTTQRELRDSCWFLGLNERPHIKLWVVHIFHSDWRRVTPLSEEEAVLRNAHDYLTEQHVFQTKFEYKRENIPSWIGSCKLDVSFCRRSDGRDVTQPERFHFRNFPAAWKT